MPDLLLELRSEEIPARMQAAGAESLRREVGKRLQAQELNWSDVEAFATPRRLVLIVRGLPDGVPAGEEELRGPRVSATYEAVEGFLRSAGVARTELRKGGDGPKDSWFVTREIPARTLDEVLIKILPESVRAVRWPKSMRWGCGNFRWVRPLRGILCIISDGARNRSVALDIEGVPCGAITRGHPYLAPNEFIAKSVDSYESDLKEARVILRFEDRRENILECAFKAAQAENLNLVEDPELLDEIARLVEWPVIHIGRIENAFSDLPDEVLQISMRKHQKFFSLRDPESQRIVGFAAVADTEVADGGVRIVQGYERVLRARLADAKFFWENDLRTGIDSMRNGLSEMGFHPALGSMEERTVRISGFAAAIAKKIGGPPPEIMHRAGELAKADLCSETVREFPELQGIAGALLAEQAGEDPRVCEAIKRQYQSPILDDTQISDAAAQVLADRADMLWGFFAVGERPTGSRDPYALRRSALVILRTLIENKIHFSLHRLMALSEKNYGEICFSHREDAGQAVVEFILERLRVYLREYKHGHNKGYRHDLVAAAARWGKEDDPYRFLLRVKALNDFFVVERSPAADQLLAMYRRATSIVDTEGLDARDPDTDFPIKDEEQSLAEAINQVEGDVLSNSDKYIIDRFAQNAEESANTNPWDAVDALVALPAWGQLSDPVKNFFEKTHVNHPDLDLRRRHHRLLMRLCDMMDQVADFGEIVD